MHFVGSTIFADTPAETAKVSPAAAQKPASQDLLNKYAPAEKDVDRFLRYGLPSIVAAAENYSLEFHVFCSSSLRSELISRLELAAKDYGFLSLVLVDNNVEATALNPENVNRNVDQRIAEFWMGPLDILAPDFFHILSEYDHHKYTGMDIIISKELVGHIVANDYLFLKVRKRLPPARHRIQLNSVSTEQGSYSAWPSPSPLKTTRNPTVIDASGVGRIHLEPGHTAALWHDPRRSDPDGDAVDQAAQDECRRNFPQLAELMVFERSFSMQPSQLGTSSWKVEFPYPIPRFTIDFSLRYRPFEESTLYVSYDLIDERGETIPPETDVQGIGRSTKAGIGHCFIAPIEGEESRVLKHVRSPRGVFCKGLKFTVVPTTQGEISLSDINVSFRLERDT